MKNVNVVFIGGQSRSGSTLLDLMLGQVEGFLSLGELQYIWQRGFLENHLCGCGKEFRQCKFWGNVVEEMFGSFQQMDLQHLCTLWNTIERQWYFFVFPYLAGATSYREKLSEYTCALGKLFTAIQKVSGKQFLVDSSKKPFHGFLLHAIPTVDLRVIHLIRDCRAVGYSWQRKKLRPEVHWKKDYMEIFSPAYMAMDWNFRNGAMDILGSIIEHYTMVQYETLARDPSGVLKDLLAYLEVDVVPPPILQHGELELTVHHTVGGNPMRFQRGRIPVTPDLEWKRSMPVRHKMLTTLLSWPLLLRYGYLTIR